MRRTLISVSLLLGAGLAQPVVADAPSFASFPADRHVEKKASTIDWSSNPDARRFATVLRAAFAKGVKFAGRYAVASWGCGSRCQVLALIDVQTGRIAFGPGAELDFEFQPDSRLLIANSPSAVKESLREFDGCPDKENYWAVTSHYYEWTGTEFRHVTDINACASRQKAERINKASQ